VERTTTLVTIGACKNAWARSASMTLRGYPQARCDVGASVPRIATELGVRDWQVQAALERVSRMACWCGSGAAWEGR
jgi:hypothetical protein